MKKKTLDPEWQEDCTLVVLQTQGEMLLLEVRFSRRTAPAAAADSVQRGCTLLLHTPLTVCCAFFVALIVRVTDV